MMDLLEAQRGPKTAARFSVFVLMGHDEIRTPTRALAAGDGIESK
jgi:hypothetical protein